MNNPPPPSCPYCGSHQLVASSSSRKVFIDHNGTQIPLLTANFSLDRPVIETSKVRYVCRCSANEPIEPH